MQRDDKQRRLKWLAASVCSALSLPGFVWAVEAAPRPTRVKVVAPQPSEPDALPPIVSADSLKRPVPTQPSATRPAARPQRSLPPLSQWMQEIDPAVKEDQPAKTIPAKPATAAVPEAASGLLGRMRAAAAEIVQERSPAPKATAASKRMAAPAPITNAVEPVQFQAKVDKTAKVAKIQADDDGEAEPLDEISPIHSTEATEGEAAVPIKPQAAPAILARRTRTAEPAQAEARPAKRNGNTQSLKLLVKIDPAEDSAETEPKYVLLDDILKQLYPDRDVSVFFMPEGSDAQADK